MSEININYPVDCQADESLETMTHLLQLLEQKYGITHQFINDRECQLSGSGVKGQVQINDEGIEIFARLGFFMIPFKSVIETEILTKLDEHFSA
ncbi:polyhydroxyalkanoic acid system family protein [Marinicella sediminis]|uniref:Polyhydroxyalkanoic acid system family protein n=1 Tax=Marinicella sediminis TaxID=1792834 RepID=A0ABV7J6F6_9GAMM|nr:polyhydroxyalkanoic acid system family protein [Marinicella sediminis]